MSISSSTLALILVRVLALYFFALAIGASSLTFLVLTPSVGLSNGESLLAFMPFAIWCTAAIVLWCAAKWLAAAMLGGDEQSNVAVDMPDSNVFSLAFSLLGLFVITDALPDLLRVLTFQVQRLPPNTALELGASETAALVAIGAKLLLGCLLLFTSRRLSSLLM